MFYHLCAAIKTRSRYLYDCQYAQGGIMDRGAAPPSANAVYTGEAKRSGAAQRDCLPIS